MANEMKQVLKVIATTADRLKDLVIENNQLIFIQDSATIAFDFKNRRIFYNQIIELESELVRKALEAPTNGAYYFVIDTAILWTYRNNIWVQITSKPENIVVVGIELPELGQENKIYAITKEGEEHISVWDDEAEEFKVVADKTQVISADDIGAFFIY